MQTFVTRPGATLNGAPAEQTQPSKSSEANALLEEFLHLSWLAPLIYKTADAVAARTVTDAPKAPTTNPAKSSSPSAVQKLVDQRRAAHARVKK